MNPRFSTILLVFCLVMACATVARAGGRVLGRVVDQTGGVLPGVTIDLVVNATELTTTTDGEGRFVFENVPNGAAELTCRLLNFTVMRRTVNVVTNTSLTVADIVMTLSMNADVVVTG